ncbi:GH3 auxin-responsive promoter family protein [Bradyrhizobium ontarionense]|uniref:GH3 auxin-responsive promoter family protein n=1 Tax=Bradyrhizobium ontarionense TaxID=2898149 RepID=A0ABY3RD01_9BRAD|nr:GH3 auxin-responsive promoter family protein [Bradyrhizobium sp. A19]UFZ04958.1 GH3 auxin-responsive promoter family protein [Bradyrhizobium sp. A19]
MKARQAHDDQLENCRLRMMAERNQLARSLTDTNSCQERVLRQLIAENADTDFGRLHHFSLLGSIADFKKAVPIRDYAEFEPWIDRAADGESNVLTAEDPVLFFMSSGTTGRNKKIPVTRSFMRQSFFPFYFAMWAGLVESVPEALLRDDATYSLKFDPHGRYPSTNSGRPHLGVSQTDFEGIFGESLIEPGTRAPWKHLPVKLADDDHLGRAYARLCMAAQHDLLCIVGLNPAMVAALPRQLALWWPRLAKDIRDGTVGGVPAMTPNPERAATLERLATYFGTLLPSHLWPNLRSLFCWNTGVSSLYMPRLAESFGTNVRVFPAPVAASEGPVAVTVDGHRSAGSPVVAAMLLEFIEADEDILPDSLTLGLSDLDAGREYHVIISQLGGLYRYALGDVVRVVDRLQGVPRLEYAGRRTLSNVAGERLRESQVVRAVKDALLSTGMEIGNVTCHVEQRGDDMGYGVAIAPRGSFQAHEIGALEVRFDRALQDVSRCYRHARESGRLGKSVFHVTEPDAFFREWQARITSGVRPAQAKDRIFTSDAEIWRRLIGRTAEGLRSV